MRADGSAARGLETRFRAASWRPAAGVDRPFVRHLNGQASPATVWQDSPPGGRLRLSVVIPTSDAYRGGSFPKLLVQIGCQDLSDFELIAVRGDPRQGRAINIGAALARGEYLLTIDDDISLPDPETFRKLVAVMQAHPDIGMAGGNNVIPADASPFQRRVMREIPRRSSQLVSEITESDLAEHGCLIMPTEEVKAVGGGDEVIPR